MKKFFAVILCALMLASASACADTSAKKEESKAESIVSQVSEEETSAPETTKEESSDTKDSSDLKFGSIEEYLEYPETKKALEQVKETLEATDTLTVDCYADGDTLVYEYKYKQEIPDESLDSVKSYLEESMDTLSASMVPTMKELVKYIDVENPKVVLKYLNNDDSVIFEVSFDKSILDDTNDDASGTNL